MSEEIKPHQLLIELDALLDTRIATVRRIDPTVAEQLLENPNYRNRVSDELNYIDSRIDLLSYNTAYIKRDMETLDYSKATLLVGYIVRLISKLQMVIDANNPELKDIDVVVNHYPYKLTEDEKNFIIAGVSSMIGLSDNVSLVNLEPKDINLEYLKNNKVLAYIVYDFNLWSTQALPDIEGSTMESLGLNKIPNLLIIAPRLALSKERHEDVVKLARESNMGAIMDDLISLPWALLFDLDMIDPILFTEFDPEVAKDIMENIEKSNSPIDVEVGILANYATLVNNVITLEQLKELVNKDLKEAVEIVINAPKEMTKEQNVNYRIALAKLRIGTDILSAVIPCHPAEDFERTMDSIMSQFDSSEEASKMSEDFWNRKGVACRRHVREVPSLGAQAYILSAHQDVTLEDGTIIKEGEILKAATFFEPIIDAVSDDSLEAYSKGGFISNI